MVENARVSMTVRELIQKLVGISDLDTPIVFYPPKDEDPVDEEDGVVITEANTLAIVHVTESNEGVVLSCTEI